MRKFRLVGGNRARLLENANKHLAKGNLERAIKELKKLVEEEPDDVSSRLKMAGLMARAKKIPDAIAEYKVVVKGYVGTELERRAIPVIELMLQFDGSLIEERLELARLYTRLKQVKDALMQYSLVAERYETEGKSNEQLDILQKMKALDPEDPAVLKKIGDIQGGKVKKPQRTALTDLEERAEKLRAEGDREGLVKVLDRLLTAKERKVDVALEAARIYLDIDKPRRALKRLDIAYAEEPSNIDLLELLAETFEALGSHEKARAVLQARERLRRA